MGVTLPAKLVIYALRYPAQVLSLGLTAALRVGRFFVFMPTSEVERMTEPKPPEPDHEPLVQPTAIQVTDRRRDAYDRAPASMPVKMDHQERVRVRAAMLAAKRMYPLPVARVLISELTAFEEFGYRWAKSGTVDALVEHLLKPVPGEADAA